MTLQKTARFRLSERDLDFLVETVSSHVSNKNRLKEILRDDADFRNQFISEEKVFRRLMDDDEILLKISPPLFFEILLRKTASALEQKTFTLEKSSTMKIPVFDTREVVGLLEREPLLSYLADMLASFTRIESYSIAFRLKPGVWKKIRFNDLDIFSLMSFAQIVDEAARLTFYKRIADICLFILGIFPEFVENEYRYPFSKQIRPQIRGRMRIGPAEYASEGRKFYRLAADHPSAQELELSDVFRALGENFQTIKKPLNFIGEHFLHSHKQRVFG